MVPAQLRGRKRTGLPGSFAEVDYPSEGFLGKGVLCEKGLVASWLENTANSKTLVPFQTKVMLLLKLYHTIEE